MEPIPVSALSPRPSIRRVALPAAHYLAIAGKGPLDQAGTAAEALLRVGEAIRLRHAAAGRNFPLPPPELLTWGSGEWKVLLRVPEIVRAAEIGAVRQRFHAGRRSASRGVVLLRLEEGACWRAAPPALARPGSPPCSPRARASWEWRSPSRCTRSAVPGGR